MPAPERLEAQIDRYKMLLWTATDPLLRDALTATIKIPGLALAIPSASTAVSAAPGSAMGEAVHPMPQRESSRLLARPGGGAGSGNAAITCCMISIAGKSRRA